jgi:autotransporter-associated beta strand protein
VNRLAFGFFAPSGRRGRFAALAAIVLFTATTFVPWPSWADPAASPEPAQVEASPGPALSPIPDSPPPSAQSPPPSTDPAPATPQPAATAAGDVPSAALAPSPLPDASDGQNSPAPTVAGSPQPAPSPLPMPGQPPQPTAEPLPAASPTPVPAEEPTVGLLVTFATSATFAQRGAVLGGLGAVERDAIAPLRLAVVDVADASVASVMAALRASGMVTRVEPDRERSADAAPSDPHYADQWALERIGWPGVFAGPPPAGEAVVAVLDTGVDESHPDLAGQLVPGASFVEGSAAGTDPNGHGTAMAGIVAARTDNGTGIAGTAFAGVKVMPVTVLAADGTGRDSDIIAGLVWAVDNDADVVLMAFSNPGYSAALQAAIDYAWSRDVVLVAAAGNDGSLVASYPAGSRGVMGISNTDEADTLHPTSNFGPAIFLGAPGSSVLGTSAGGGYGPLTGTSAAAAMVAGAAALLRAADPQQGNGQVVHRLASSADRAGTAQQTGNGRLNLARAMDTAPGPSLQPSGVGAGSGGPFVGPYVAAVVKTWTGALDGNWNTAGNWSPSGVPAAGDDLVFPTGAANLTMTNGISAGRSFNSITFTGSGYSVTGNSITLAGPINASVASGTNTIGIAVAATAVRTITVDSGTTLVMDGVISGTNGGLIKAGAGTLTLGGANTCTGAVTVNAGTLNLNNSGALCSGDFTLAGGTTVLQADLTFAGSWINNGGSFTHGGFAVTFAGTSKTIDGTSSTAFGPLVVTTGSVTMNNSNTATSLTFANNNVASSFSHGGSASLTVAGDVTINQASGGGVAHAWNVSGGSATVNGSLTFNVTANNAGRVARLAITGGSVLLHGDLVFNNTLLAANSAIDMSGGAGTLRLRGAVTLNTLATLTAGTSSKVVYEGTGNQTVAMSSTFVYNTLEIAKPSGTATLGGAGTVANMLLTQGPLSAGGFDLTITGDWTNNGGSYAGGSTTVSFTGSSVTVGGTTASAFPNVVVAAASAVAVTVSGTNSAASLSLGNGANALNVTLTHAAGSTFSVSGDVTLNQPSGNVVRTWDVGDATVTVSGLVTFGGNNTSTGRVWRILIGNGTLNANGGLTFVGSHPATKVIDMSGGAGVLNLKGALSVPANSSTLTAGTSSVFNYADSVAQAISFFSAGAYRTLRINNTSASGATLSGPITSSNVTGNVRVGVKPDGSPTPGALLDNGGFAISLADGSSFEVA